MSIKEGYIFLGWSSESIFDLDDWINTITPYQNIKPEKVMVEDELVWKVYDQINPEGRLIKYMKDTTFYLKRYKK